MRIEIDGIEELAAELRRIADRTSKRIARAGAQGAQLVRSSAVRSIQTQSPGRLVTRTRAGGQERTVTAAAAGNAPNSDTGTLVRSIQIDRRKNSYFVGTALDYGARLEATHPWLMPAFEANLPAIKQLFADAVRMIDNG